MLSRIRTHTQRALAVLSKNRCPGQVAFGAGLGAVLGLIPKDNLLAVFTLIALTCFRVNQLVGICVAVLCAMSSVWSMAFMESVGVMILDNSLIAAMIARIYQFPLVPWTSLDSPVVAGGLAVGLSGLIPIYVLCKWAIPNHMEQVELEQVGDLVTEALQLGQVSQRSTPQVASREIIPLKIVHKSSELNRSRYGMQSETKALKASGAPPVHADPLSARPRIAKQPRVMPALVVDHETSVGPDTILRETIIEVVRYRRPLSTSPVEPSSITNDENNHASSLITGESMPVANLSTSSSIDLSHRKDSSRTPANTSDAPNLSIEAAHATVHATNREESLKYLLSHIAGSKEASRKSGKSA